MESRLSKLIVSVSAVALIAAGAMAQSGTEIDFGETTEAYAGDGLCADPRFEGTGMAEDLVKAGRLSDAEDCSALFAAGDIQLEGTEAEVEVDGTAAPDEAEAEIEAAGDPGEAGSDEVDADEDEEASGTHMQETAESADADALADEIELAVEGDAAPEPVDGETGAEDDAEDADVMAPPELIETPGEDEEEEAAPGTETDVDAEADAEAEAPDADAEPDTPAPVLLEDDAAAAPEAELQAGETDEATASEPDTEPDTEAVEDEGAETGDDAMDALAEPADPTGIDAIEFGDDESEFALDGECDDARFVGDAMTNTDLFTRDIGHDATDCRAGVEDGSLRLRDSEDPSFDDAVTDLEPGEEIEPVAEPAGIMFNGVNFGDDESKWANDGECDDPRFEGKGMTTTRLLPEDTMHDASDCLAAWKTGELMLTRD